jgi:hypothetical protein
MAKVKSWAVKAGFLLVWEVISAREQERTRDGGRGVRVEIVREYGCGQGGGFESNCEAGGE